VKTWSIIGVAGLIDRCHRIFLATLRPRRNVGRGDHGASMIRLLSIKVTLQHGNPPNQGSRSSNVVHGKGKIGSEEWTG